MTELTPYTPPAPAEIDYTWNLAGKLSKTEFVPANLRNRPEAILAVFLTGRELGIGPMQSLRDIYPVNGRPALMASLMVARVRGLGHRFHTIRSTDELATVQIHRKGEPEPEPPIEFTLADAKRAELTGKTVWRQYPKAMLWNRAASAACRRDCPEALGGAVYTPEELGDGDSSTTATWGAPEAPEQPSDPGPTPAPPAPGPGSDPTSEAGERPRVSARVPADRHDPASDLTSEAGEHVTRAGGQVASGSASASRVPASDTQSPEPNPATTASAGSGEPRPSSAPSLEEGRRPGRGQRRPADAPAGPEQPPLDGGS